MTNRDVDRYLEHSEKWPAEVAALRQILLDSGLSEELKWGKPCYTSGGKNIVIIQEMNDFLALMFFKGSLLSDKAQILKEQGPNSRSAKRMQFTSVEEVSHGAATIVSYVDEAITIEAEGRTVDDPRPPVLVEELQDRLGSDPAFKTAFESLTPGRQREYNLHFSSAKQTATRIARIDKCTAKILAGKGFSDR